MQLSKAEKLTFRNRKVIFCGRLGRLNNLKNNWLQQEKLFLYKESRIFNLVENSG